MIAYGYFFTKRKISDNPPKILLEVWQDNPNDNDDKDNKKDRKNSWKKIKSEIQDDYVRPIWVDTWEEYRKLRAEGKTNVHVKSKPSTGPYFLNEKKEICFQIYDEYDHISTVRMDNPLNLNVEEATKMMNDINMVKADFDKESEKEFVDHCKKKWSVKE